MTVVLFLLRVAEQRRNVVVRKVIPSIALRSRCERSDNGYTQKEHDKESEQLHLLVNSENSGFGRPFMEPLPIVHRELPRMEESPAQCHILDA